MKKLVLSSLAATSMTLGAAYAWACEGHEQTAANESPAAPVKTAEAQKAELAKVSVPELASLLEGKQKNAVQVFDANGDELRKSAGVIPGATLLTSAVRYDVARELPADKGKKLVFYCANEQCGASHMAAKRAREAGYSDVAVLPAGIQGWKAAGKATSRPSQS